MESDLTPLDDVSLEVKENSLKIINSLIKYTDLYKSSYNTIIIEYDKQPIYFIIDVGKNAFGYFIEFDNITCVFEERLLVNDENIKKLNLDTLIFL